MKRCTSIHQNPKEITCEPCRLRCAWWVMRGVKVRGGMTALGLFFLMSQPGLALDLQGTHWDRAARLQQIDPLMLYAIALTESGRPAKEGQIRPWPWALNVEGQAILAVSKVEATNLLATHRGKSVDVGLLQVNTRWHGHRVDRLDALLDPETNLTVGATILKEALASTPGDLTAGIGRYHSARPERAKTYARAVLSLYRHLLHRQDAGAAP